MSEPLEERLDKLANENHPTRRPSTEGAIIREVALECLAEIRRLRGEISRLDILAQRHANEASHSKEENERLQERNQLLYNEAAVALEALASAREVVVRWLRDHDYLEMADTILAEEVRDE